MRLGRGIALLLVLCLGVALTPTIAAQAPLVLNIGVIGAAGSPTVQGVMLAVEMANARGPMGLADGKSYTFAVVVADARTPQEVKKVIPRLKQAGVVAIFGPDDNVLAAQSAADLAGARLPVFTGATSMAVQTGGFLFRTQASDLVQFAALAEVLIHDERQSQIAIYQCGDAFVSPRNNLSLTLAQRGITPVATVVQGSGATITAAAKSLLAKQPGTIVALGTPEQAADLYRTLRANNYMGIFATPVADDSAFIANLPFALRGGIYGVTGWTYATETVESISFGRLYVSLFSQVPNALSAAAYDGTTALISVIHTVGVPSADAISSQLPKMPPFNGIQGIIDPGLGNGELSAASVVFVTGSYGASKPLVRFNKLQRLELTSMTPAPTLPPPTLAPTLPPTLPPTPTETIAPTMTRTVAPTRTPTVTLPPSETPVPSLTPVPSATPEGVVATVKAATLNVRTGPGTDYETIGKLKRGDKIQLLGASADYKWYVVNFRSQQAWIVGGAQYIDIWGDPNTLPVVQPPPTPTPLPATPTPTAQPYVDIVMINAGMSPPIPQPGQPFVLTITIQNQGAANASEFAVATSFEPGNVYSSQNVPGLAAGQQAVISLGGTVTGTGNATIAIVLDLNNQLDEGPTGKANNKPPFSYKVDKPYVAQGSFQIAPGTSVDFYGGTQDITFDPSSNLVPINGAKLGALSGVQLSDVHFDYLTPAIVNNTTGIAQASLLQGLVIGVYTAEGNRGVLRVSGYNGSNIILEYFIYAP